MRSNAYLVRRDPFRDLDALVRSTFGPGPTAGTAWPAVETHRDGDDAVIRLELPGVDVDHDVTVEVKGRLLVIAGERKDQRAEGARSEFRYGTFRRTFRLAPGVSGESVSAAYDAGVLTVRVGGAFAEAEGHQVAIATGRPEVVAADSVEG